MVGGCGCMLCWRPGDWSFFFSGEQGEFGQVYSFHNGEWAMYNTCYRIISGCCNVPRQMWHSLHMSKESHRTSEGGSLE